MISALVILCLIASVFGGTVPSGNAKEPAQHSMPAHSGNASAHHETPQAHEGGPKAGEGPKAHEGGSKEHEGPEGEQWEHKCNQTQKEDCSAPFQTATDCFISKLNENKQSIKSRYEAKKPELIKCFTDNKCVDPSTLKHNNTASEEAQKKGQCMKALMQKGFNEVKKCVQSAITDVTLPKLNLDDMSNGSHQFHPEMIGQVLNESCANGGDKKAVLKCLAKSFTKDLAEVKKEHKQFCESEASCLKSLSPYCKCKFGQVFMEATNCTKSLFKQGKSFTADVPQCAGVDLGGPHMDEHVDAHGPTSTHGTAPNGTAPHMGPGPQAMHAPQAGAGPHTGAGPPMAGHEKEEHGPGGHPQMCGSFEDHHRNEYYGEQAEGEEHSGNKGEAHAENKGH